MTAEGYSLPSLGRAGDGLESLQRGLRAATAGSGADARERPPQRADAAPRGRASRGAVQAPVRPRPHDLSRDRSRQA